jgi:hypothetical protein
MLQFQRMRVVSDLITLKECSHFPGLAIVRVSDLMLVVVGVEYEEIQDIQVLIWGKKSKSLSRLSRLVA